MRRDSQQKLSRPSQRQNCGRKVIGGINTSVSICICVPFSSLPLAEHNPKPNPTSLQGDQLNRDRPSEAPNPNKRAHIENQIKK